ncbi:MAG: acyltransferase [Clostridia bacterium]|nr:acyltransferase [Clostridia bacterium]
MAKSRNNLVELARFLFSLLVVGYHVQMTWANGGTQFFAGGALAVEFFFLISGYFLARSIEKINSKEQYKLFPETGKFMWGKIKGILPVHIVAIIAAIIVILAARLNEAGGLIVNGLPSVFLVHMAVVWDGSFANALIVPEWYLSAMLITMLFMFPIALLLRKKLNGIFTTIILVGIIIVALVICGFSTNWALPQNFVYDLRAWGEMCVGMFAFYLSSFISKKESKPTASKVLPIIEVILYCIPLIFGFVPFPADYSYITMIIAVICVFGALAITFSGKGLQIHNEKLNSIFGFLGSISLAIYLFHPVLISIFEYEHIDLPFWAYHLIIFPLSISFALLYTIVKQGISKFIQQRKNSKDIA